MFLLVPAHPGCPGQIPQSRKTVVCLQMIAVLYDAHNHFTVLSILSGTTRVSRYQKKHFPTHTHRGHQSSLSAFSVYYDPWCPPYAIHMLHSLFPQSLSKFSLVCLLAWHPSLHTPYISSPNHFLLFATHAHTIATCFAVVPRLCHLILVSLSTLYSELLSCNFTPHIHLTILISASEVPPHFPFLQARPGQCGVLIICNLLCRMDIFLSSDSFAEEQSQVAETDDSCQLDFTEIVPVSKDTVDSCSSECLHGDSFAEVKEHLVDFAKQDPDNVCCFILIHFYATAYMP